jgi:hypothetical protein
MFRFGFFNNGNEQQPLNEIRTETESEIWEKRAKCLDYAAAIAVVSGFLCQTGGTLAVFFTNSSYLPYTCSTLLLGCVTTACGGPGLSYLSSKAEEKANHTAPEPMTMRSRYC